MNLIDYIVKRTKNRKMTIQKRQSDFTNPLLAKRRLLNDDTIVPVDEAENAEKKSLSLLKYEVIYAPFSAIAVGSPQLT